MASIAGITTSTTSFSSYGASTAAADVTAQATEQQDTVKLSAAAQAKALYHQGETVNAIASALGTTTKQIDDYLNITLQKELQQTLQSTLKAG